LAEYHNFDYGIWAFSIDPWNSR